MTSFSSYVICTSPRSGSTLLCALLRETQKAGDPGSHFHCPSLERWIEVYGLDAQSFSTRRDALGAVFSAARERGRSESDLFGLRLQRHSFDYFMAQARELHPTFTTDRAVIEAAFGPTLFIHLTRDNKLDQAISYVKAQQSGLWHLAPDGTEIERRSAPADPVYDRRAIAQQITLLEGMDTAWEEWFDREHITPYRVRYRDLSANPFQVLRRVTEALGLDDLGPGTGTVPVARLSDGINREWSIRYLRETGK